MKEKSNKILKTIFLVLAIIICSPFLIIIFAFCLIILPFDLLYYYLSGFNKMKKYSFFVTGSLGFKISRKMKKLKPILDTTFKYDVYLSRFRNNGFALIEYSDEGMVYSEKEKKWFNFKKSKKNQFVPEPINSPNKEIKEVIEKLKDKYDLYNLKAYYVYKYARMSPNDVSVEYKNLFKVIPYSQKNEQNMGIDVVNSFLNRYVEIIIDRPINSTHPEHEDIKYELNYGYVPNTKAEDGEPIDAYIMGIAKPIDSFKGKVIAIIKRKNDNEDKLVVAKKNKDYSVEEIKQATHFVEKFFDIEIVK